MSTQVQDFNEARERGFSPTRAARWAVYARAMRMGLLPFLTLDEAVAQVSSAKRR